MSRGVFAGLSLNFIHAAKFNISPLSSSATKLRLVLPYFTSRKAGEITTLPAPPPPKGPSNSINVRINITQPGKPVVEGEAAKNEDSVEIVYSDGTVFTTVLEESKHSTALLQKVEKHARGLRLKAEALAN